MKKGTLITVTVIVIIVLSLFFWVKNSYNSLVKADEQVKAAWSQVENVYQRRADLIPNLVATVKGYAEHESETLESVVEARSKATQVTVDPDKLDAEQIMEFQKAQGELSQAIGRLVMLRESYPDLKANQNFRDLQAQLEGTENIMSSVRMNFNETSRGFNNIVRSVPKYIIASMFGFETKGYFEASAGAETAPKVEF